MLARFIDWKRALLLFPVLIGIGAAAYVLALRDDASSSTPRAALLDSADDTGTRKGDVAPDFEVTAPDGETGRLSELHGRPVIINFWATWCASCLTEMPALRDLQDELGSERLEVVAVNAGESSGDVGGFLQELDAPEFRIGMDPTLAVADAYGVRGMPHSVFIDADGVIRAVYIGQLDDETMRRLFAAAEDGAPAEDIEPPLRYLITVARERVLVVEDLDGDRVRFASKSLRCDDTHCAEPVLDTLAEEQGVISIERRVADDPPSIIVRFDATTVDRLTDALARELEAFKDPLYTTPLEVTER
jgi:thiol-disulfide isomerase/thioredoxin